MVQSTPQPAYDTKAPAITTTGLTKQYGPTFGRFRTPIDSLRAVDNLNITVERNEIFGFLGPNGAGKTTTMRMLLGLVNPTSGSATMLGMDVAHDLASILARTGSIIENPTFYPFLSGADNLRLVATISGAPPANVDTMLDLVDLTRDSGRAFKKYSLGMKQRLAVAASLLASPDLLILDEPANGLDPAGIVDMRNLMKRLKSEGKTVFISSHVLAEIEQICDRIAILDRGRVMAQGKVTDLLQAGTKVRIVVPNLDQAIEILSQLGWANDASAIDGAITVTAPLERSWELNKALADAGIYASEIGPVEASLEQYFLGVTKGGDA